MAFDSSARPNVNALWAGLLVEELVRQGVGLFVVCPGSRSAPLAVAVARAAAEGRTDWLVHPDERAAAFVALGWARSSGLPAAVVTTSGTAVANLLPAVVEADAAGVPMLLLTADRPPELRETGANQTIRQPGIFGSFTRWAFDAPVPSADLDPAVILTTAAHAFARTLAPAGPVHLNLPFREPLGAEPDGTDAAAITTPISRWTETKRRYTWDGSDIGGWILLAGLEKRLAEVTRGVVVLGATDQSDHAVMASRLATRLGWPLLPDVTSQARLGAADGAVPCYDLALASLSFAEAHQPDAVVLVGSRPVSKRLLALIDIARPDPYLVVRSGPERFDPSHIVTDRIGADPSVFLDHLVWALPEAPPPSAWLQSWQSASDAAGAAASEQIGRDLSEPFVARTVARLAPNLVLAASMPIRDVDAFAASDGGAAFVTANRGASGIDGTVATAHGVARGLGEPVVLLIGDLALLHDQTSLMLLRDGPNAGPPVVVVVVNNDGGGIFHFLPVSRGAHPVDAATFEAAFGAPHGLTFAHAAAGVGLAYHAPETADAFEATLAEAIASGQSAVIEVRTDRAANEALHARITRAAAAAVDALG
ncbi:MAG TPA: 2-succinyl-5-enolpyruvyl-6-hydroxy-3-cyclohexene-1-carboxylic-acid synthase [Rubricoccaceae bacterium]